MIVIMVIMIMTMLLGHLDDDDVDDVGGNLPLAISEDYCDHDHDGDDDHDDVACSPLLCPRGSEVGTDRLVIWRMVALRSRLALGSEEALVMKRRRRMGSLSGRSPAWPA